MLPKTPPKVKEPNRRQDEALIQRYTSIDKNERTTRNLSLDIDSHNEQTKYRKETFKLRQHIAMLEGENIELHKVRIENQNQISLWTEKTRRLNDQLIRMEEQSLRESSQTSPYELSLKKEIQILSSQLRQLASIKHQLEDKLNFEKEKSDALQMKYHSLLIKDSVNNELQSRIGQLQQLTFKYKAERERYETKLTRTELYINKLQGEVDYLTQQLKQQLNQLSEQKLELTIKEKQDALKEVKHYQQLLKTEQLKNHQQGITIQGLNSQLRRLKQQLDEMKQQKRIEISRVRAASNEFELVVRQLRQENDTLKKSYQLRFSRWESDKQQKEKEIQNMTKKYETQIAAYKTKIEQLSDQLKLFEKKESSKNRQLQQMQAFQRQLQYLKNQNQKLKKQIKENHQTIYYYSQKQLKEGAKSERNSFEKSLKPKELYYSTRQNNLDLQIQISKYEENQRILVTEIEALQRKIKQQRVQGQQLVQQLQMSQSQNSQLQEQLKKTLQQLIHYKEREEENIEIMKKIREQEGLIIQLATENERWKSYRLSQEDEARRQARRHKKKVQELEQQLINEKKASLQAFQELQCVCQGLKQATANQQFQHSKEIEQEKLKLNAAMDQMEAEFRKLLNQCEQKIDTKQLQIDLKTKELEKYEKIIEKQKIDLAEQENQSKNASFKAEELRRQTVVLKDQLTRVQETIRKGEVVDYKTRVAITNEAQREAQREAKARYQKVVQQKVVQIQRLKLEVKDLQQEAKKQQLLKRQLELLQNKLRFKEKEEIQKNQRFRYLEKMAQTLQGEIRSYKSQKEQLLAQIKLLQREIISKKESEEKVSRLQNDLLFQRSKYERLTEDRNKDQLIIRELKQKYQDSQIVRQRLSSNSNAKQKQLQFQLREIEQSLSQKVFQAEQLYSQCQKYKTQIRNHEEKERSLKRQLQEIKYRNIATEDELKARKDVLQEKQYDNLAIIQQQKRMIQMLTLGQKQKHHQIEILLEKIAHLEGENITKGARQVHVQENKRNNRKTQLQKIALLCGISHLDDESTFGAITDWVSNANSKVSVLQSELSEYRKMISQLKEDKQNLSQKYQKYKSVAMQYKDRKQMQRLMLRNTYRFNDEILTHCQNIIKGVDK